MSLVLEFAGAAGLLTLLPGPDSLQVLRSVLLTGIHVAESLTWLTAVACMAMGLRARIQRPGSDHWIRRISGSAFIAFAIRLAWP
jgi:threonine/homoserine/homoserine lactone efflux protein